MSKLIVIEGACDGVGKTTQVEMLKKHLEEDNISVYSHHFPTYDSDAGKLISNYLSGSYGNIKDLSPYFINSLYAIDRKIVCDNFEKLDKDIILVDRYTSSSLIYQSALIKNIYEKKDFIDFVNDYEFNKLKVKKPDKVIFLTAPFDVISKMRNKRINNSFLSKDIHEEDIEFMRTVYDNARFMANFLSWDVVNCCNGNEMKSKEEIHNEIYKLVKKGRKKNERIRI